MPLNLNGFSAHIQCDGKALEQYKLQVEDEKTLSCWIASEAGKEFVVKWGDASSSAILMVCVYMDGRLMERSAHIEGLAGSSVGVSGSGHVRSYTFSPLVLTDEEKIASRPVSEKLGSIEVTMQRAKSMKYQDKDFNYDPVPEIGPIHERSKKAGVHAVSLGAAKPHVTRGSYIAHGLEAKPFAKFKFHYRPIELLQANGIAPLLPQPHQTKAKKRPSDAADHHGAAPGPSDFKRQRTGKASDKLCVKPDPDTDDDDDKDEEADDVAFLEEQLAMLQKRILDKKKAKKKVTKGIKREITPIHVPTILANEIIDLT